METMDLKSMLTKEQCDLILEKKLNTPDYTLLNYQIKASERKTGFLGEHFHLICNVQTKENNKKIKQSYRFFLKTKPTNVHENALIKMFEDINFFEKEVKFYKLVENENISWAPKMYAELDGRILVLEDLTESNYRLIDENEFDLNHCEFALMALVNLHAFSFKWIRNENYQNYVPDFLKDSIFQKGRPICEKYVNSHKTNIYYLLDLITESTLSKDELKRRLDEKFNKFQTIDIYPSTKYPNVICHGDMWTCNIMFKYERRKKIKSCCLIDFQTIQFLPPVYDLLFFILCNTSHQFQHKHFNTLVDFYYKQLADKLKTEYNMDLNEIFEKSLFMMAIQEYIDTVTIIALQFFLPILHVPLDHWNEFNKPENTNDFYMNNCAKFLMRAVEEDATYKEQMIEFSKILNDMLTKDQ